MRPELRQVATIEELARAKSVRRAVFIEEQGVPEDIEMDEHDADAIHVICLVGGKVVGTGRLVEMPDGMKLGRVAVLPEHRNKGIGALIVKWLLDKAAESGYGTVYANVQLTARNFYDGLGFIAEGDIFMEAGIKHVRMTGPTRD
jgi:predicted GNAT family N-acyltransferase